MLHGTTSSLFYILGCWDDHKSKLQLWMCLNFVKSWTEICISSKFNWNGASDSRSLVLLVVSKYSLGICSVCITEGWIFKTKVQLTYSYDWNSINKLEPVVVVTKSRFSQFGWADPNAGVEQWSHTCDSSTAWPGDVALLLLVCWLWCTLGAEVQSNLFVLPHRSTSFKFRFLNDSLSEYFFPERPQGSAVRHHQAESHLLSGCVFWWSVPLPEELCPIYSFPSPACLMAIDLHCDSIRKHSEYSYPTFCQKKYCD